MLVMNADYEVCDDYEICDEFVMLIMKFVMRDADYE